jgi:hypothetical protein
MRNSSQRYPTRFASRRFAAARKRRRARPDPGRRPRPRAPIVPGRGDQVNERRVYTLAGRQDRFDRVARLVHAGIDGAGLPIASLGAQNMPPRSSPPHPTGLLEGDHHVQTSRKATEMVDRRARWWTTADPPDPPAKLSKPALRLREGRKIGSRPDISPTPRRHITARSSATPQSLRLTLKSRRWRPR